MSKSWFLVLTILVIILPWQVTTALVEMPQWLVGAGGFIWGWIVGSVAKIEWNRRYVR